AIHNIMRWLVILLALFALYSAYRGWIGKREWKNSDRLSGLFFTISLDIQLLLGIVLYFFLSPLTQGALQDFGQAMAVDELRFFALEHAFIMLLAVIIAHLGNFLVKKAPEAVAKHRRAAVWFTLAVLVLLVGIPWWRPLIPGLN
ncbi:MAG: hypothetical protein ACNA8H_05790, partial [Anaerolineales bacterium]